jgi:hypothetical protein
MTSKLLRIVPAVLALSIPALAADPPAAAPADPHHEAKDAKKRTPRRKGRRRTRRRSKRRRTRRSNLAPLVCFASMLTPARHRTTRYRQRQPARQCTVHAENGAVKGNTQLFFSLGSWVLVNPRRHERPLVLPGCYSRRTPAETALKQSISKRDALRIET